MVSGHSISRHCSRVCRAERGREYVSPSRSPAPVVHRLHQKPTSGFSRQQHSRILGLRRLIIRNRWLSLSLPNRRSEPDPGLCDRRFRAEGCRHARLQGDDALVLRRARVAPQDASCPAVKFPSRCGGFHLLFSFDLSFMMSLAVVISAPKRRKHDACARLRTDSIKPHVDVTLGYESRGTRALSQGASMRVWRGTLR